MNFLADESVDQQIVRRLREDGHHVWYVAEMQPGLADIAVLEEADREAALLLTADKDFGELVFRQRRTTNNGQLTMDHSCLQPRTSHLQRTEGARPHALCSMLFWSTVEQYRRGHQGRRRAVRGLWRNR